MPDYAKTLIYRIVCKDTEIKECYIGSTTNMTKRRQRHKFQCLTGSEYVYGFMRENGGFQNWDMILIEAFPCKNNLEARKRERYWVEYYGANLNTIVPYISTEEVKKYQSQYHIEHKNESKQYYEQYYIENKEKLSQKITCECGSIHILNSKSKHLKSKKHQAFLSLVELK